MNRLFVSLLVASLVATASRAQSIPIKTVPVAEGNQFLLFPSRNLAMGGVGVALADPLADPYVNPARGVEQSGFRFTSTPAYYGYMLGASGLEEASARTLPVGLFVHEHDLFFGASMAWQQLVVPGASAQENVYGFGMAGLHVPGTGLAAGASVLYADLSGLEGVRLLYAAGDNVRQSGSLGLYRLGLYQRWADGRTADVVVLHHRFDMAHRRQGWSEPWIVDEDVPPDEYDQTRGWAVQAGYRHPLSASAHVGVQLTGDWKHHPRIPNYDLMRIPRDPGTSAAYNVGVGFARRAGASTFALDLIYEPIRSHTWADALRDTVSVRAHRAIRAGEKTVENRFRFHNAHLRLGLERTGERTDVLLGLRLHAIRYALDQQHHLQDFSRDLDEHWIEWTLSGGLAYRFPAFHVRYVGLLTFGTGQPGVEQLPDFGPEASYDAHYLVAPAGALVVRKTAVVTHQLSVIVPLAE